MGCHTWCAKKVNRSIEEARELWIAKREEWIITWQEYCEKKRNGEDCAPFEKYTFDKFEWLLQVYKRQLQVVKKGLCNVAVMNQQPEHSYYIESKGFFVCCDDFHDPFRVNGYPDDKLFSYQECLDFIKKYEEEKNVKIELLKIGGHEKTYLEEFWEKYPDGYIHFG